MMQYDNRNRSDRNSSDDEREEEIPGEEEEATEEGTVVLEEDDDDDAIVYMEEDAAAAVVCVTGPTGVDASQTKSAAMKKSKNPESHRSSNLSSHKSATKKGNPDKNNSRTKNDYSTQTQAQLKDKEDQLKLTKLLFLKRRHERDVHKNKQAAVEQQRHNPHNNIQNNVMMSPEINNNSFNHNNDGDNDDGDDEEEDLFANILQPSSTNQSQATTTTVLPHSGSTSQLELLSPGDTNDVRISQHQHQENEIIQSSQNEMDLDKLLEHQEQEEKERNNFPNNEFVGTENDDQQLNKTLHYANNKNSCGDNNSHQESLNHQQQQQPPIELVDFDPPFFNENNHLDNNSYSQTYHDQQDPMNNDSSFNHHSPSSEKTHHQRPQSKNKKRRNNNRSSYFHLEDPLEIQKERDQIMKTARKMSAAASQSQTSLSLNDRILYLRTQQTQKTGSKKIKRQVQNVKKSIVGSRPKHWGNREKDNRIMPSLAKPISDTTNTNTSVATAVAARLSQATKSHKKYALSSNNNMKKQRNSASSQYATASNKKIIPSEKKKQQVTREKNKQDEQQSSMMPPPKRKSSLITPSNNKKTHVETIIDRMNTIRPTVLFDSVMQEVYIDINETPYEEEYHEDTMMMMNEESIKSQNNNTIGYKMNSDTPMSHLTNNTCGGETATWIASPQSQQQQQQHYSQLSSTNTPPRFPHNMNHSSSQQQQRKTKKRYSSTNRSPYHSPKSTTSPLSSANHRPLTKKLMSIRSQTSADWTRLHSKTYKFGGIWDSNDPRNRADIYMDLTILSLEDGSENSGKSSSSNTAALANNRRSPHRRIRRGSQDYTGTSTRDLFFCYIHYINHDPSFRLRQNRKRNKEIAIQQQQQKQHQSSQMIMSFTQNNLTSDVNKTQEELIVPHQCKEKKDSGILPFPLFAWVCFNKETIHQHKINIGSQLRIYNCVVVPSRQKEGEKDNHDSEHINVDQSRINRKKASLPIIVCTQLCEPYPASLPPLSTVPDWS